VFGLLLIVPWMWMSWPTMLVPVMIGQFWSWFGGPESASLRSFG